MFAPLVVPFLSELGIGITEVALELGLSQKVANTLGGAAIGAVSAKVGEAVEDLGVRVIGKENVRKVEEGLGSFKEDAFAVFNQDTRYFLDKHKQSKLTRYHEPGSAPVPSSPVVSAPVVSAPVPRSPPPSVKDISKFIADYSSKVATEGMNGGTIDSIKIANEINPNIASMLGQFLADKIPDDALYKQIASVYNGKNITLEGNFFPRYGPNNKFVGLTIIDETNKRLELNVNKGLVIPALYGVYLGPHSPNNSIPVDLLDAFCSMHDEAYAHGGYLDSLEADYQLISRISQNFNRLSPNSKPWARWAILYFSTSSMLIHGIKGSFNKDPVVSPKDDFFTTVISPDAGISDSGVARETFFNEFEKEISVAHSSVVSNNPALVKRRFGSIIITLL
jgi:hypothetical protein